MTTSDIFANASSFIKKPATLSTLVSEIDKLGWYSPRQDQEGRDLRRAHLLGVSLRMKMNVAPDPLHIDLLGLAAVATKSQGLTQAGDQPWLEERR